MIIDPGMRDAVLKEIRACWRRGGASEPSVLLLTLRPFRSEDESPVSATMADSIPDSPPDGASMAFHIPVGAMLAEGMSKADVVEEAADLLLGELAAVSEIPVVLPCRPRTGPRSMLEPANERWLTEYAFAEFGGDKRKALNSVVKAFRSRKA